ncbi:MAG TPA: hypothetical protein VIH42_00725 [Thermoguttaceae bacterium]
MSGTDIQKHKRELRLKIGRMRRRINNHWYGAQREGRRLVSWRYYAARYPGYALLAAFGVGMAASGGFRRGWLMRRMGLLALRQATGNVGRHLWQEFQRIWSESGDKA